MFRVAEHMGSLYRWKHFQHSKGTSSIISRLSSRATGRVLKRRKAGARARTPSLYRYFPAKKERKGGKTREKKARALIFAFFHVEGTSHPFSLSPSLSFSRLNEEHRPNRPEAGYSFSRTTRHSELDLAVNQPPLG